MGQRRPQDSIRVYAVVSTPDHQWVANTGLAGKTAAEVTTTLLGTIVSSAIGQLRCKICSLPRATKTRRTIADRWPISSLCTCFQLVTSGAMVQA